MGDKESVKEPAALSTVEREASGSLKVRDGEIVKEALSCCSVDCGERVQVHLPWEIRRM